MPLRANHPRPQLQRAGWVDLGGTWACGFDDAAGTDWRGWLEDAARFDREILVPYPPESRASGLRETGYHPVVWYRRAFRAPELDGQRLLLHFGAVDYRAHVWVNGQLVATHEGGHTPFHADITEALAAGDEQVAVVRAEDDPADLAQPRGKQDWQERPHRIWYHRTTGIWQPVWLEVVPALHIAEVRWTPDLGRAAIGLEVRLNRAPTRRTRVRVRLRLRGEVLAEDACTLEGAELRRWIGLDAARATMDRAELLWAPEHPNLIEAELELREGQLVLDDIWSYAALRSVGTGGGRFLLNGRPYYLRLALEQGYWPVSHLALPDADAARREVELVRELGFNGVRIHQKVEDPRFLYWCDRLGLLVWGEMANAYVFSDVALERLTREWLAALRRDYSHPCIVAWVPFNESWGVPDLERDPAQRDAVRALYHLTKALDPTRPAIGNDGWELVATDIWGVHDYALDGATLRERYGDRAALERTLREVQPGQRRIALEGHALDDEPVVLSELGGIGYAPAAGEEWYGYNQVHSAEEYLARLDDIAGAVLDSDVLAGFCYTQLTDTEQETNGLLTAAREHKLDPAAVRAILTRPARSMPGEAIARARAAAPMRQPDA